jgi:hypothetical protein
LASSPPVVSSPLLIISVLTEAGFATMVVIRYKLPVPWQGNPDFARIPATLLCLSLANSLLSSIALQEHLTVHATGAMNGPRLPLTREGLAWATLSSQGGGGFPLRAAPSRPTAGARALPGHRPAGWAICPPGEGKTHARR